MVPRSNILGFGQGEQMSFLWHALLGLVLILRLFSFCHAQPADAAGLLAIKESLGALSPNLTSWNGTEPCVGPWAGVTCNFYNKVIALNLSSYKLAGSLPGAIGQLVSLQTLDLSTNQISGTLPTEMTQLVNLEYLDLSRNSITGGLPTGFEGLSNLQWLNLTTNLFNVPFPQSLLSLTNLRELRLDNNYFTGSVPNQISNLQYLEQLWMGNNSLSGALPTSLSSLYHLNTLTAWGNPLDMVLPAEWGVWTNIMYMNLHNSGLHGSLPPQWGQNFTKMQKLHLYNNDLTGTLPDSWQSMTIIKEMRMHNNDLTGPIPDSWKSMKTLTVLRMNENLLTGAIPDWVAQLQQNNATVDFRCNYLTGADPSSFNSSTWSGNCFNSDLRAHSQKCDSGDSCSVFLEKIAGITSGSRGTVFKKAAIIGIIIGVVGFFIVLAASWKLRKSCNDSSNQADGDWEVPQGLRRFTYKEIMKITKGFNKDCEIGEGGFGKVYLAHFEDGKAIAIKRAAEQGLQGTKEFRNEMALLSRLHHRHLVRLEGFCDARGEQILVYEYMKNGNLHHHLFDNKSASSLNWYRRLEIAIGVAQGLDYLHTFADPPVIHRDVKPSNILLDENMIAKVADFGISKANPELDTHVSTRPAGTAGYLDPEYFLRRQLTTASDVYGYGVVLLELLTGQVAIDHSRFEDYNLVEWVKPKLRRKGIQGIIDPRIGPHFPAEAYTQVAELAVKCTSFERVQRPSMQEVVSTLELLLKTLTPPPDYMMSCVSIDTPHHKGDDTQGSTSTDLPSQGRIDYSFKETILEPR